MSREELMIAFESRLLELLDLAHIGEYASALAVLDEVYRTYGEFDVDGWLKRSVLACRGLILSDKGDVRAAIETYRAAQIAHPDSSNYLVTQLALARLMQDPDQAIRELEIGLERAEGIAISTSLGLLSYYAQVALKKGTYVPLRYEMLFTAACRMRNRVPPPWAQGDAREFTDAIASTSLSTSDMYERPDSASDKLEQK